MRRRELSRVRDCGDAVYLAILRDVRQDREDEEWIRNVMLMKMEDGESEWCVLSGVR